MSARDVIAPTSNGERYAVITSANELVARRRVSPACAARKVEM
jgi:hypothetical protein